MILKQPDNSDSDKEHGNDPRRSQLPRYLYLPGMNSHPGKIK